MVNTYYEFCGKAGYYSYACKRLARKKMEQPQEITDYRVPTSFLFGYSTRMTRLNGLAWIFFVRPGADAKAILVYQIQLHAKGFSRLPVRQAGIFLLRRNKNPSKGHPCSPLNLWVHGRNYWRVSSCVKGLLYNLLSQTEVSDRLSKKPIKSFFSCSVIIKPCISGFL